MRPAAFLALLAFLPAGPALAHESFDFDLGSGFECREPVRWASRHEARDARLAITTEDGKITLLVTDHVVALQLSDRTMRKIERKLRAERHEDDDGPIGNAIKAVVLNVVHSVLDHSAECPIRELRDVRYEDDRLVLVTRDGDRLFEHLEVDDGDLLESFHPRDAEAFVREFRRVKARAS